MSMNSSPPGGTGQSGGQSGGGQDFGGMPPWMQQAGGLNTDAGQWAYGAATGPNGPLDSTTYGGAAGQQGQLDQQAWQQQTGANRANQSTPWASSQWTKDPTTGQWSQATTLDPSLQGSMSDLEKQWAQAAGQPMPDANQTRQRAEDAIYGRETSRLDPQWKAREEQERSMLANQGLDPSSQAFQTEMGNFDRGRNDAYQGAMNQSISGGGEEAQRQMMMAMALRNQPLMELQQMMGFAQMPGYTPAGQVQTPDVLGAYDKDKQANADKWGSVFGAAGAGVGGILKLLGIG